MGSAVWVRFKVGRDESLWYYRAIADRVQDYIGEEEIANDLRLVLDEVAAG